MAIELRGHLYNNAGAAILGADVALFRTSVNATNETADSSAQDTGQTTTGGLWSFSEAANYPYDVRITSGTSIRWRRYNESVQMEEIEVAMLAMRNPADTFKYDITPGAISGADKVLNLPVITTTDTLAVLGLAQTFSAAQTFTSTVTVGVSDSGHDVQFFGATANTYMLWDENTDDLVLTLGAELYLYDAAGGEHIKSDGTDMTIYAGTNLNLTAGSDVVIPSGVGLILDGSGSEKIESDGTDISVSVGSNGDINIPVNIGLTFGDDGEKIEGDGTNLVVESSGTLDVNSGGVLTLDSGAAINLEPAAGSAILLDGTISVDAGVVTGATSITSTVFVGNVTGNVSGTAATITGMQANQAAIEAETDENTYIPPDLLVHNRGVAKVWCQVNAAGTLGDPDHGVSTVDDDDTGDMTVNFVTAFSSGIIAGAGSADVEAGGGVRTLSPATGSIRMIIYDKDGTETDKIRHCIVFGSRS